MSDRLSVSFALVLSFLLIVISLMSPLAMAATLQPSLLSAPDGSTPITYVTSAPRSPEYTITLITGDVLYVSPQSSGALAVAVREAPRPGGIAVFQTIRDSVLGSFIVPSDVRPLLATVLDSSFFNINYLIANHLSDDQAPDLNMIVQYENNAPMTSPWSSSLISSLDLSSIHSQSIAVSKQRAAEFGSVLLDPNAAQSMQGIKRIYLDRVFTAADDQSGPLIGADFVRKVLGFDGAGIKIAVIDTGIDVTHPDFFFANGTSKVIVNADFECAGQRFIKSECDGSTLDLFGHGTHVAGIAAGTGAASGGKFVGIAPGAALMNIKVLNRFGFGLESWIIAGMQAAATGVSKVKADVISMSLGGSSTDGTDPMSQAVNSLTASTGVTFVIAAGNSALYGTVASPGAATAAITVSASTKLEPVSIADFSSKGPRVGDFSVKPDIAGPGVDIVSTCSSTAMVLTCPAGSRYLTLSGTSMATPHVSGSVALLLQAARKEGITLTPAQVKNLLQSSSRVLQPATGQSEVNIYSQGAGLVRIDRAITSNFTFTPAELSLGLVPYNTTSLLSGSVQITNRGLAQEVLTFNYTMYDVPSDLSPASTGSSFTSLVSLNQTSLTLPPGGTGRIGITINAPQAPVQKFWSLFSGRITATSSTGEQEHAIFGFTKEGPRQTLNITGITPNGTPAKGQLFDLIDVQNAQGFRFLFGNLNSNGQAILRVPLSTYAVFLNLIITSRTTNQFYRLTDFNVVVQSTVNLVLDARTAGAVALNLQANPFATAGLQQDDVFSFAGNGLFTESDFIINGNWNIFAENPSSPQIGTLWTQDRWQRTLSPSTSSPVLYDMAITRQQLGPAIDTVTSSNLTTTTGVDISMFHADTPGTMLYARMAFPAKFSDLSFALFSFYPISVPIVQTQYQQAGESLIRQMVEPGPGSFWFDTTFTTNYVGFNLPGKIWAAGESLVEPWLEQPVHPTLLSAGVTGSTLSLTGYEVTDRFGHPGVNLADRGANFTLNVFLNGMLGLTSSNFPCPQSGLPFFSRYPCAPLTVSLPSGSTSVRVQMLMSPDPSWSKVEVSSQTTVSFTVSSTTQGSLPLPNSRYTINGLSLDNSLPAGKKATNVTFGISLTTPTGLLFNSTSASVKVSVDDGATWIQANTTITSGLLSVQAVVPTGLSTYVSVLVHAQSADGTSLDQQIIRAIHIGK